MSPKKYIADSKMFEYDKHYRECTQSNQPFIRAKINPANGYYHVQIDLMPCDYVFSKEGLEHLKNLFEDETRHLKPKASLASYSVDKELSWVDGVVPSRLDTFCESLYDLSQQYRLEESKI